MEEKKIYQEIPGGRNKFHSAILTTFSFNFHHFEYQVLKTLKQKWITNVGILVDDNMLDNTIGLTSGGLRQLTQTYSINGIKAKGAFHPKINFFIGDKELLMVMGSGNVTSGGHGKNHETFTTFYVDSPGNPFLPILIESYNYIKHISEELEGFSRDRIVNLIPNNCELLKNQKVTEHEYHKVDDNSEIALIYNDATSIFSQLVKLIPQEEIYLITIVCPYFDEDGKLLLMLLDHFDKAEIQVFLSKENSLPPVNIPKNNRISFFPWELTKRGKMEIKGNDNFTRKLHSKIFNFKSNTEEFCLIGSANATIAAFGNESKRGINDEFGALYKSKKLDFLKSLGISGSKIKVIPSTYTRSKSIAIEGPEQDRKKHFTRISSCDLNGLTIKLFLKSPLNQDGLFLKVFNDVGYEIFRADNLAIDKKIIVSRLSTECLILNPAYVIIENANGSLISNKQVINYLDKLYHTDPSKVNRTITSLIGALEIGKINEFQILSYLNDLNSGENQHITINTSVKSHEALQERRVDAEMTYEEAVEASKNKEAHTKLIQIHNTIRIWQTLTRLFQDKNEIYAEVLNDEEEDGFANIGKDRPTSEKDAKPTVVKNNAMAHSILRKTEKLASDFVNAMKKTFVDKELKLSEVSMCQFLVVSHVITAIHHFTSYNFPEDDSKDDCYTPEEWKKLLKNSYHTIMQNMLLEFSRSVLKHDLQEYQDDEYKTTKLNEYQQKVVYNILIYNYLINGYRLENPYSRMSDLACLTIFRKLGQPDENFNDYAKSMAESDNQILFKYIDVIRLRKRLSDIQIKTEKKEEYFYHKKFGVCFIKETTGSQISFVSILQQNELNRFSIKDFKKLFS